MPSGVRRLLPVAGPVLAGVVVGVAWRLLSPTADVVRLPGGTLVAPGAPELAAAQDGVLLLLGAAAGLLCGLGTVLRPGRSPVLRSTAVLLGCVLGSLVAWRLGAALGPAPVHDQVAAHPAAHPVSPLGVSSPGVLLVWPVVAAFVAAAGHLAAGWRRRAAEEPWPGADAPGGLSPAEADGPP